MYGRLLGKTGTKPGCVAFSAVDPFTCKLFRRDQGDEVEFITIMTFDSIQSVIDFQGDDYQRCYVPDAAQRVLSRWDQTSAHFELKEMRSYE
jgi:hypothetical protein